METPAEPPSPLSSEMPCLRALLSRAVNARPCPLAAATSPFIGGAVRAAGSGTRAGEATRTCRRAVSKATARVYFHRHKRKKVEETTQNSIQHDNRRGRGEACHHSTVWTIANVSLFRQLCVSGAASTACIPSGGCGARGPGTRSRAGAARAAGSPGSQGTSGGAAERLLVRNA